MRRARLATVSRAFRRFCDAHANCMRQHTQLVVPCSGWQVYVEGISRWLAWHANTLQAVQLRIVVRRGLPCRPQLHLDQASGRSA